MAELNDIYNTRLLELAADIPHSAPLLNAQATATAHSKLCGSTVTVALSVANGQITAFSQIVKACLLGQASAAIVGHNIINTPISEFHALAATMRNMLKQDGPLPTGKWRDLALLEPVRPYKSRHASTLLIFDAVEKALAMLSPSIEPLIDKLAEATQKTNVEVR